MNIRPEIYWCNAFQALLCRFYSTRYGFFLISAPPAGLEILGSTKGLKMTMHKAAKSTYTLAVLSLCPVWKKKPVHEFNLSIIRPQTCNSAKLVVGQMGLPYRTNIDLCSLSHLSTSLWKEYSQLQRLAVCKLNGCQDQYSLLSLPDTLRFHSLHLFSFLEIQVSVS